MAGNEGVAAQGEGTRTRRHARVFLGLGSNLGDRCQTLMQARCLLDGLPGTCMVDFSRLYLTAPVGGPDQDDYLNQVVQIDTLLTPRELLQAIHLIEAGLGRERLVVWGPRTIDVDILWYDGSPVDEPDLHVPHPRLEERRFVLEPLAELAPDLVLPSGMTVADALEGVQHQAVTRLEAGAEMCGGRRRSEQGE